MIYDEAFVCGKRAVPEVGGDPGVFWICQDRPTENSWRKVVEGYYGRSSPRDQAKFRKPLRSANDELFYGVLHEALLARALELLGYSVHHDPLIGGRTPDMLVATGRGEFVCEVATVLGDPELRANMDAIRALNRGLGSRVATRHLLAIQYYTWPTVTAVQFVADAVQSIARQHQGADFDEQLSVPGFHARILGTPARKSRQGRIAAWGWPQVEDNPAPKLKGMLSRKARRYRNIGARPLVLAACDPCTASAALPVDIVEGALYGQSCSLGCEKTLARSESFFNTPPRHGGAPMHTHVSGVLVVKRTAAIGGQPALQITFYANPFAGVQLADHIFKGLPRLLASTGPGGQITLDWHDQDSGVLVLS